MIRALSHLCVAVSFVVLAAFQPQTTRAQDLPSVTDGFYIQIQALPNLNAGIGAAERAAERLPGILGMTTATQWHALALGPFADRPSANAELRSLRRDGFIPGDSFITDSRPFRQIFFPATGLGSIATNLPDAEGDIATDIILVPTPAAEPTPEVVVEVAPEPAAPVKETLSQARRSERALGRSERRALQTALEWEGHYTAAIDGAFGPGTRRAMQDWQRAKGYSTTGVLTTSERVELLTDYAQVFDALGLESLQDSAAGIELIVPGNMVRYAKTEAPFVRYDSTNDRKVRMILISQPGDRDILAGLYDVMQTLTIVPTEGTRKRNRDSFTLTGQNNDLHSYTYARHDRGLIKGFTLIWPPAEARLMNRVVETMQDSFTPISGVVLPPEEFTEEDIDLVAGLEIRRPTRSRSGVFVSDGGAVLTASDVLDSCTRLTIDQTHDAEVVATDIALGLALIKPKTSSLSPIRHARFRARNMSLRTEVAVSGYSFEGALGAPSMTYGTLADTKDLEGNTNHNRLKLNASAGDVGGPVIDAGGLVAGLLIAANVDGKRLPPDVFLAAKPDTVTGFLRTAGLSPTMVEATAALDPIALDAQARDMTALIGCWR